MVVRMRANRAHRDNRRSHHALTEVRISKCKDCGAMHLRHRVCMTCGKYLGKQVIDIQGGIAKKAAKSKKKETNAK